MTREKQIESLCRCVNELNNQSALDFRDFGDKHRKFYLPRFTDLLVACVELFPDECARVAKDMARR